MVLRRKPVGNNRISFCNVSEFILSGDAVGLELRPWAEMEVWKCAGILGISPGPYTLRHLKWMVQGRREETWDMVSILATRIFPEAPYRNPYRKPSLSSEPVRMATAEDWKAFASWFPKAS